MGIMQRVFWRVQPETPAVERRASVADGITFETDRTLSEILGGNTAIGALSYEDAIGLPPVFGAINFLSSTLAKIPMRIYRLLEGGKKDQVQSGVANLLARAPNEVTTSYDWRKTFFAEVFGPGRGYSYIERDRSGTPLNIYLMEFNRTTVKRLGDGAIEYHYRRSDGRIVRYNSSDVIDLAFMRCSDYISSRSPVKTCAMALTEAHNASRYSNTVFGKNGVPPYVLTGPFEAASEVRRATSDILKAARKTFETGKAILGLPIGHELKRLGDDPEKMQLTEVQRFAVEQVARIYSVPPIFIQDLSKMTYSNAEQQDGHLVKHTLMPWVEQFEQELTLKLFGRDPEYVVDMDMDGLLRGDLKSRMEGKGHGISSGILTPNEARASEGLDPLAGGDDLMIQGATVPIRTQSSPNTGSIGNNQQAGDDDIN